MKSKIFKYIYAMLCLLPAIAVGVTCLYVANNDNAYQSYSGEDYTLVEFYNDVDDLPLDSKVYTYANANTDFTDSGYFAVSDFTLIGTNINSFKNADVSTIYYVRYYLSKQIYAFDSSYNVVANASFTSGTFLNFSFKIQSIPIEAVNNGIGTEISYVDSSNFSFVDNVFYYSLDKVENSSVFSWVKSNFLYSGVNQFVGIFGGTNSNISFYLTWVLTISLCYLGFEVLMLFINMARNLIHSFTDKDRW